MHPGPWGSCLPGSAKHWTVPCCRVFSRTPAQSNNPRPKRAALPSRQCEVKLRKDSAISLELSTLKKIKKTHKLLLILFLILDMLRKYLAN